MKINFSKFTGFVGLLLIPALPVQAATCNDDVLASTPDTAFTINNDGTASHTDTGLMWKVCSEGQSWSNGSCLSTPEFVNDWSEALGKVQTQNATGYAGFSNWRLPNIKELLSIVEFKCHNPSINETVFGATPAEMYWTSTHSKTGGIGGRAFSVNFNYGTTAVGYRSNARTGLNSHHVRLVRSK